MPGSSTAAGHLLSLLLWAQRRVAAVLGSPDGYIGLRSAVADEHRPRDWLALVGVE